MSSINRILLPVDFSEASNAVLREAASLARNLPSEVILLHVHEVSVFHPLAGPLGYGIAGNASVLSDGIAERQKQLDAFGIPELAGLAVRRLMSCGDPAQAIVECARTQNADLILMSTRGHGTFRRFLLGSVTAKVLHDAECAVWTAAHAPGAPLADPMEIDRVMCGVNFDSQSVKTLRWAADFAKKFGASLTVAHAINATPPELADRYVSSWHEGARCGAEERLHSLLRESGTQAEVLIVEGDPAKALNTIARRTGVGLLVIGRSLAPSPHGRLGSRAYGIICQSNCPVVSI